MPQSERTKQLVLFSAATLQVALFAVFIVIISSVGCVWNKAICNTYMYVG